MFRTLELGGRHHGTSPKIGITGLPRSGKSAVMSKVLDMIVDERVRELRMRGGDPNTLITAGLRMEPILEGSERQGYKIIDIVSGEEGIIVTAATTTAFACSVLVWILPNWSASPFPPSVGPRKNPKSS